jgi:hypothetical protein
MPTLVDALAAYVEVLARAAQETSRAEDRKIYTMHLAAAAEIFACLQTDRLADASKLVGVERRAFGQGFLSGDVGSSATAAFNHFASLVEAKNAA